MEPRKIYVFSDESYYTNADGVDDDHNYRALGFVIIDGSNNLKKYLDTVNTILPKGRKKNVNGMIVQLPERHEFIKIFLIVS